MSELGRRIRKQVRAAADAAGSHSHVVTATNVGGESHVTSIHTDDEATVITRDGETEIIPHRDERP